MISKYPELAKFSSYESILEKLEEKGVLKYVVEYRKLRDEVDGMLKRMRTENFDVDDQARRFNAIRNAVPHLAPKVKDPPSFIKELTGYIESLGSIKATLEERYKEAAEVMEYLKRLEELHGKGEVKEEVYLRLKSEYEEKLRKIKEGAGTVVIGKETEVIGSETEVKR